MSVELKNNTTEYTYAAEKDSVNVKSKPVYDFFKRVFDILLSLLAIGFLAFPMAVVALIICIDSPGASPIYVQERVGKNGKKLCKTG